MPGGWPALLAVAPLLGPAGWVRFGVAPPGRDAVVFDPVDCALRVAHVDLDGGAEHHDLQVGRVWQDGAWGFVGVEGMAAADVGLLRIGDADAWIEVRGGGDELRGTNQDGVEVRWRWEGGRLLGYTDPGGVRTTYTYGADGALLSLSWPDGSGVQLAPGRITGSFGAWSCRREGARTTVTDPGGGTWRTEAIGEETVLIDPTGAAWRTHASRGRLAGWTEAGGSVVRLGRGQDGRLTTVLVDADRWSLPTGTAGVLAGPGGARWTIERDARGALVRLADAVGRSLVVERDGAGRLRNVWWGGASRTVVRDRLGRVVSEGLPGSLRVEATRDARGRVARIADPSGATWTITRDAGGAVVGLGDPVGGAWLITRDRVGQVIAITDPRAGGIRVERRADGRITRVDLGGGGRWELLRGGDGLVSALRDPSGHRTGWLRDALGRITGVLRPDGSQVSVLRDGKGEVIGVGGLRIDRDGRGRPRAMRRADGGEITWAWDAAGRIGGVIGPGVGIGVDRGADGAIGTVRIRGTDAWTLARDGAGRVVGVSGPGGVRLRRDGGGRIIEVAWETTEGPALKIDRDLRGLVARVRVGGDEWKLRRDAVGRLVGVSAGAGVDLGVDRDAAGRPTVVRFASGWLARYVYEANVTTVRLQDGEGSGAGMVAWARDEVGRLARRTAEADWVFRRDPLGTLAAAESALGAWSRAPDRVEGPAGYEAHLTPAGRPASVVVGEDGPGPYGLPDRTVTYTLGPSGEVTGVAGAAARVSLVYDGLGRLTGLGGQAIRRDALGGILAVGTLRLLGYDGLLRVGDEVRVSVPGIAWAGRGGGLLLDDALIPVLSRVQGPVGVAPTGRSTGGAGGETGAGDRFEVAGGGPLLGRLDTIDPYTGQHLGPGWEWPWAGDAWEVQPGPAGWAEPDGHTESWWDPAPWLPHFPDPVRLLVDAGELPAGGTVGVDPPGLPWMPASFAPALPALVPDPNQVELDDDPLVELIWRHAHAPVRPLEAGDVARAVFGAELAAEIGVAPGLDPELPGPLRP